MFVVKHSFRNYGTILPVGTVIQNPTGIKHFKSRLASGHILMVTEQTKGMYAEYFMTKHGVDILKATPYTSPIVPTVQVTTKTTADAKLTTEPKPATKQPAKVTTKAPVKASTK